MITAPDEDRFVDDMVDTVLSRTDSTSEETTP
jgi:hypothetical protein